jgi:hypothetical protein
MEDHLKAQMDAIAEEEIQSLRHITDTLSRNLSRSLQLLHKSIKLEKEIPDEMEFVEYMYDVARATIVFVHSSFETTLRAIVAIKLHEGAELKNISFPERKEKLSLEELSKYRGRTVDDIINESIDVYLRSLSFNSAHDLAKIFSWLEIPQDTFRKHYSNLDRMIKRRHQIVHEADNKRNSTQFELEAVSIDDINAWHNAIAELMTDIAQFIADSIFKPKITKQLKDAGFGDVKDLSIEIRVRTSGD